MFKVIITAIALVATISVPAQETKGCKYSPEHVLIHFKKGILNEQLLNETSALPLNHESLISDPALLDMINKLNLKNLRKVVRRSTPNCKTTIARNGEIIPEPDFYNLLYADVPLGTDIPGICKKIGLWKEVFYAEPDYYFKDDALNPNDPYFPSYQKGLEQANDADIDVKRAWDFTVGSNAVRVAIIDSGIDYHHPDLGNGVYRTPEAKVINGYDYDDKSTNCDDVTSWRNSHGTAVAGIIGALSNNGIGIAGIAGGDGLVNTGVSLVGLRVEESNIFGNYDRPVGQCIEAIYDASKSVMKGGYGCHIINFSGGGYYDDWEDHPLDPINSYRKALSYAANNGVIFIASKGNDGSNETHYPSDYADNLVISVGASDNRDARYYSSNYGNGVDVVAPGTSSLIYTTKRIEDPNGLYGSFNGTSAAAPVVSGIAALLKTINIDLHRDDVESIIQLSAEDKNNLTLPGYDDQIGHGRVNAGRALELLHNPYILQHHTAVGGTSKNITYGEREKFSFLNDAGNSGLAEGAYIGKIYQVTKTVNIPKTACGEKYFWVRTTGATIGWSAANPNNNLGYCHIVSQTETTATLRTYVYFIETNIIGQSINKWYPVSPQNVVFAYTTLTSDLIPNAIDGPSTVCEDGSTYSVGDVSSGALVTWQATPSNLFAASSGVGTTAVLNPATSSTNGNGTITFTISNSCTNPVTLSKPFIVGNPRPTITGEPFPEPDPYDPNPLPINQYLFIVTSFDASQHNWYVNNEFVGTKYGSYGLVVRCKSTKTVKCNYTNACGTSDFSNSVSVTGECPDRFLSISPNPVSDELNISFEDSLQQAVLNQLVELSLFNNRQEKVYSVRVLSKTIKIPMRDLPNGDYYLKVTNKDGEILQRRIIVDH